MRTLSDSSRCHQQSHCKLRRQLEAMLLDFFSSDAWKLFDKSSAIAPHCEFSTYTELKNTVSSYFLSNRSCNLQFLLWWSSKKSFKSLTLKTRKLAASCLNSISVCKQKCDACTRSGAHMLHLLFWPTHKFITNHVSSLCNKINKSRGYNINAASGFFGIKIITRNHDET